MIARRVAAACALRKGESYERLTSGWLFIRL